MTHRAWIAVLTTAVLALLGQEPAGEAEPPAVVADWFERMNAIDGSAAATEALVALYHPDALHITAPESHQIGTVVYRGHEHVRMMLERWSEAYAEPRFRRDVVTARETSRTLYHTTEGPWGGPAVAVSFNAAFTRRSDGVRLAVPGAAFFQLAEGKIRELRLYFAASEQAEVEPLK